MLWYETAVQPSLTRIVVAKLSANPGPGCGGTLLPYFRQVTPQLQ